MTVYKINNNKVANEVSLYILILLTIVLSRDTLVTSVKLGFYKSFIIYGAIIFIFMLLFLVNNHRNFKINKNSTLIFAIYLGLIMLSATIKMDFQMYIISIIFYIFLAYFFIYIFTFEDFLSKYSNIMVVVGLLSLICTYFIRIIIYRFGLGDQISLVTNSSGLRFFNFGVAYVVALPNYIRNFGIFREPGVYQFFLIIPLLYEVFIRKNKKRYFHIIILIATLVSTFSLVGMVALALIALIYFVELIINYKKDKVCYKRELKIIVYLIVISMVIFGLLYFLNDNFKGTINQLVLKAVTSNDSSSSRMESLINNIKAFLSSPIIGRKFAYVQGLSGDNTNSLFSLFAIFGVFTGILTTILHYRMAKMISKNKIINIVIFTILIMITNTQFLIGNSLYWIILFSVLMKNRSSVHSKEIVRYKGI